MKKQKAFVLGEHGKHHRVFYICNARVVKEWSTDEYLAMGKLAK